MAAEGPVQQESKRVKVEDLGGLRLRIECAQGMVQAFKDGGFSQDEAFKLMNNHFFETWKELEERNTPPVPLHPGPPPDDEALLKLKVARTPPPPAESVEQAVARFAGTIFAVAEELVEHGIERSDAVDIAAQTAHALAHSMAGRLCPP